MAARTPESPRRVALFLLLLALPQAAALGVQFARGFRPWRREPVRVPLSWDMFAVRIERCAVAWNPPITVNGKLLPSLARSAGPIEWDYVNDSAEQYRRTAAWGCGFKSGPTRVSMRCFLPEGRELEDEFDCP
jgi:hypothetical protein